MIVNDVNVLRVQSLVYLAICTCLELHAIMEVLPIYREFLPSKNKTLKYTVH